MIFVCFVGRYASKVGNTVMFLISLVGCLCVNFTTSYLEKWHYKDYMLFSV